MQGEECGSCLLCGARSGGAESAAGASQNNLRVSPVQQTLAGTAIRNNVMKAYLKRAKGTKWWAPV